MHALLGERVHDRKPKISEGLLANLEAMNASPAAIARLRGKAAPEKEPRVVEVEAELWDAFLIFRQVHRTQWRWETKLAGRRLLTIRHGLDYGVVPGMAPGLGVTLTEQVWDRLRDMEAEALAIYAARERNALGRQ